MIDNLLERLRSGESESTNKTRATRERGTGREPRQRRTPERSASIVLSARAADMLKSIQNDEDVPRVPRVERENSRGQHDTNSTSESSIRSRVSGSRTSSRSSSRRLIRSGSTGSITYDDGVQGSAIPGEKDIEEEGEGQPF